MTRPHITCHMVTSVDGKVTGEFLYQQECEKATDIYYEWNRTLESNGFICGRVTMEGSFTQGWYPDLAQYEPVTSHEDFVPQAESLLGRYAVAFDTCGRLGWKNRLIVDDDPGYGGAQIIEVLSEQASPRYLGYLQALEIPYIFAGKTELDVNIALTKLYELFGVKRLLLEGGSILNGSFLRANVVDELSLVVAPMIADNESKPLFTDGEIKAFRLQDIRRYDDVLWLHYCFASEL